MQKITPVTMPYAIDTYMRVKMKNYPLCDLPKSCEGISGSNSEAQEPTMAPSSCSNAFRYDTMSACRSFCNLPQSQNDPCYIGNDDQEAYKAPGSLSMLNTPSIMHHVDLFVRDACTPSVPSDPPQSLRHSYDLPRELEAHKASRTHLLRHSVENHIHANAYMRESTTNYGSCDLPQSQGIKSLPNDEEQGAYQAPSPRRNSFIQDPYILNEMSGEFEPVEPVRLLEQLPGIKNTTRVAYQAAGQCTSSPEWGTELQPSSHHHSLTPDDLPRSLGHCSNDVDNPYVMSETSPVTDNDLLCLNRRSLTAVKPHHDDSIDALRDSPRSLERSTDYVHHVYTVPETYKVSNFAMHNLSLPCDITPKPYQSSVKLKS
jgi:hypothetical protein